MKRRTTGLTHFNQAGEVTMVNVSTKQATVRKASAQAFVAMSPRVLKAMPANKKGDPLEVARIAGILAAKKTADLIPLCHSLPLSHIGIEMHVQRKGIRIVTEASTTAETGVEMEAMTAAAVAALTIYDMTKALDKAIEIRDVYLLSKSGGKSGVYQRATTADRE